MSRTTSSEFQAAVAATKKFTLKPDQTDLLKLYGLYKQATQDPPIEKAEALGMFDIKGKAKRKAWQQVVNDGVTPEKAEKDYISLVEEFKGKYKYDANKTPEQVGS